MKTALGIAVLGVLLAAPSQCFALWGKMTVSKEQAKELGLEVRSKPAGANQVRVELEFGTEGALKNFTDGTRNFNGVQLRVGDGDNPSLTVPLKEDRSKPGRVVLGFTADQAELGKLALWVYLPFGPGGQIYELRVKDFIEPKKKQ